MSAGPELGWAWGWRWGGASEAGLGLGGDGLGACVGAEGWATCGSVGVDLVNPETFPNTRPLVPPNPAPFRFVRPSLT